jgi:very-short-patch-repair endonuclease
MSESKDKIFTSLCHSEKVPMPDAEFIFHPVRKWRFDFAWPRFKIALEVEGGAWTGGRHTRGKGFIEDMEKYNQAALLGWTVYRCTPTDLLKVKTIELIKKALTNKIKTYEKKQHLPHQESTCE